jgi:hypothetical protein
MLRFSDARNFGRTLTGLALIVGPAVMLVAALIGPDVNNDNKLKELNSVAAHKSSFILSGLLYLLSTLFLLAASVGVIHLFRNRRVTLGQVAGGLLLVGTAVTIAFYVFQSVEYEMVNQTGLDRVQLAKFLDKANNSPSSLPLFILFLIGIVLGSILLAVALWRSGLVPKWAAVVIVVAGVFGFAGGQSKASGIVNSALLLIGLGMLGRTVLSMSDEKWDAPRDAPGRAAEPIAGSSA